MTVSPATRTHLLPTFTDFLTTIKQFNSDAVQNTLVVQKLELPQYLHLFLPSLEWVLQCIAHRASEVLSKAIWLFSLFKPLGMPLSLFLLYN